MYLCMYNNAHCQQCSILDHVSCSTWLREDLGLDQTPSKQAIENEEKLIGTFKVIYVHNTHWLLTSIKHTAAH